jgi:hypothetical protein
VIDLRQPSVRPKQAIADSGEDTARCLTPAFLCDADNLMNHAGGIDRLGRTSERRLLQAGDPLLGFWPKLLPQMLQCD